MNPGPLVDPTEVPQWLRGLADTSAELDSELFTKFSPPPNSAPRPAAVLLLFGEDELGPDVLLLRRADTLGSHAGQVAFPGGGADPGDDGPVTTALREAEEEAGVDPGGVRPVALLPELYIPVSNWNVTPVLAYWREPCEVHPVDPGETAEVARIPLAELTDPANRFQVYRGDSEWKGPAFTAGGLFVWGFTAGLLSVLLALGGWEREWDRDDVRDLHVALHEHNERTRTGAEERIE